MTGQIETSGIYIRTGNQIIRRREHVLHFVVKHRIISWLSIFAAQQRQHDDISGVSVRLRHLPIIGICRKPAVQEEYRGPFRFRGGIYETRCGNPRFEHRVR
jgi:hypothetical protein